MLNKIGRMTSNQFPVVYRNGQYRVVPLIKGFQVRNAEGQIIDTYLPSEVAEAVEMVDTLAYEEQAA